MIKGGVVAFFEPFFETGADDGQIGYAIVVDDRINCRRLVEVVADVEGCFNDFPFLVRPGDGLYIARHSDHGCVVSTRGVASYGHLIGAELEFLVIRFKEAYSSFDVLKRGGEVR